MVMGSVGGGGGGGGTPGPPGPPGPAGPPGPSGIDFQSPLSVHLEADILPGPIGPEPWRVLDFALIRTDTHGAAIPGPAWTWAAPVRGFYHLVGAIALDPAQPIPAWQVRVLKSGIPQVQIEHTRTAGQIAWMGLLSPGERLHLEFQAPGQAVAPLLDATLTRLSITGCGVVL